MNLFERNCIFIYSREQLFKLCPFILAYDGHSYINVDLALICECLISSLVLQNCISTNLSEIVNLPTVL